MTWKLTLAVLASAAVAGCVEQDLTTGAAEVTPVVSEEFASLGAPQFHYGPNPFKYTDGDVRINRPSNPAVTDKYQYWAELTESGVYQGRFKYQTTLESGPANVTGKVLCFTITAMGTTSGLARIAGVVTASNNADVPVGQPIVWSVSDNYAHRGDPADRASSLLGLPVGAGETAQSVAELYCALGGAYPENPLLGSTYVHVEFLPKSAKPARR